MAETPTAWWCPECGGMWEEWDTPFPHQDDEGWCDGDAVKVPLLTPGLSLADLAARLRDAGYDVQTAWDSSDRCAAYPIWIPSKAGDVQAGDVLVVAAKEPADG